VARIGVFVCCCGRNIASTVDVEAVAEALADHPGVVHSEVATYMCSDPSQSTFQEIIHDKELDGVVVAACSPQLHEGTFRMAAAKAGINPYLCEIANIREHCSWVHPESEATTVKAIELARIAVEKVKRDRPLEPFSIPVRRRALVLGGGIAGIQAALDVARAGVEVVLVEREPVVGGHAARLTTTYPHFESARSLLRPKVAQLFREPKIRLLTSSSLDSLTGFVGNFTAKITTSESRWTEETERLRDEIYPVWSPADEPEPGTIEEHVGAVVAATGFDLYPVGSVTEYGGGEISDVVSSFDFERLLAAGNGSGLRRPSDGSVPKEVVFIQCVRSRDKEHGVPYCSRICCMVTAKQATRYMQLVPDGQAYVFSIDVRAHGIEHEDFIRRASEDHGVLYLRGRVSKVFQRNDKVVVWGADTLSETNVEIEADTVVLATALTARDEAVDVARSLGVSCDPHGFMSEAHPKLRPVETSAAGIFLAGACQSPRDISGTTAHASGAASKVLELFSSPRLARDPEIARVDANHCVGCLDCRAVCPYGAISAVAAAGSPDDAEAHVASVNAGLCQGCGLCAATCRSKSIELEGTTEQQLYAEVEALGSSWSSLETDGLHDG
jgi:heterodisulfide reductase subunit A